MNTPLYTDKKFQQQFTHQDANAVKAALAELDSNISNVNSLNLWIPKNAVATKAALVTTYPAPAKNWAAMVLADGYVYINDGLGALEANWVNSGQKAFPVDVAVNSDIFLMNNYFEDGFFHRGKQDFINIHLTSSEIKNIQNPFGNKALDLNGSGDGFYIGRQINRTFKYGEKWTFSYICKSYETLISGRSVYTNISGSNDTIYEPTRTTSYADGWDLVEFDFLVNADMINPFFDILVWQRTYIAGIILVRNASQRKFSISSQIERFLSEDINKLSEAVYFDDKNLIHDPYLISGTNMYFPNSPNKILDIDTPFGKSNAIKVTNQNDSVFEYPISLVGYNVGDKLLFECIVKSVDGVSVPETSWFYLILSTGNIEQYLGNKELVSDGWYRLFEEFTITSEMLLSGKIDKVITRRANATTVYLTGIKITPTEGSFYEKYPLIKDVKLHEMQIKSIVSELSKITSASEITEQFYGSKIKNFLSKVSEDSITKLDSNVKIKVFGDSIIGNWRYTGTDTEGAFISWLQGRYPNKTITWESRGTAEGGYSVLQHLMHVQSEIIEPNVDLLIWAEYDRNKFSNVLVEEFLKETRKKTTADILLIDWTIPRSDLSLFDNPTPENLALYKLSDSYQRRIFFARMANKYNCEFVDFIALMINEVLTRKHTSTEMTDDATHPSAFGYNLLTEELKKHFPDTDFFKNTLFSNHNSNNEDYIIAATPFLYPFVKSKINLTGWSDSDYLALNSIKSQTIDDSIEISFNGVGIDIYTQNCVGESTSNIDVLIDGVKPSTIMASKPLEYATQILWKSCAIGNEQWHRANAAFVTSKILNNGELSREFEIKILTITRNAQNVMTAGTYQLKDVSNNNVIGTGDIFSDSTFNISGGSLIIPVKVFGSNNWIDNAVDPNVDPQGISYIHSVNDTFKFYVKSNWIDVINIQTTTQPSEIFKNRIFGLKSGEHMLRLTKLDSFQSRICGFKVFNPYILT
jgi:hypothetical protein